MQGGAGGLGDAGVRAAGEGAGGADGVEDGGVVVKRCLEFGRIGRHGGGVGVRSRERREMVVVEVEVEVGGMESRDFVCVSKCELVGLLGWD